jgi:hypothetical protein
MGLLDRLKGGAENVSAETSKVGVGANRGQMDLANRAQRLVKVGVDTPAHIDSMTPTGATDNPGGAEQIIELTVRPAGGEPYQVTTNQYIYPTAPFSAGEDVNVKVDPDDPNVVMIFGKG